MSTRLRLGAVELATSGGQVRYDFIVPLTLLAGSVGTGKSSLFEPTKHALGGNAVLSPMANEQVSTVAVEITSGDRRSRLTRPVRDGAGRVAVVDLVTRVE